MQTYDRLLLGPAPASKEAATLNSHHYQCKGSSVGQLFCIICCPVLLFDLFLTWCGRTRQLPLSAVVANCGGGLSPIAFEIRKSIEEEFCRIFMGHSVHILSSLQPMGTWLLI